MDNRGVRISVIVPVYNAEDTIIQCLKSILSQTLSYIEVICVNDGSPDDSINILNQYSKKDCRVVVINQQNRGPAVARNNAIKAAKGEYIAFMDPDDWYPNREVLELLYKSATEHSAMICGGSLVGYVNGKIITDYDNSSQFVFLKSGMIKYNDYQFDHGYTRFIYNREFIVNNHIMFPDYRRYQDPPFMVKAMIKAKEFYAVPNNVYCYRMENKRLVFDARKTNDFLKGLRDVMKLASENNLPVLFSTTLKRFDQSLHTSIFLNFNSDNVEILPIIIEMNDIIKKYTGENSLALRTMFEYFGVQYRKISKNDKIKTLLKIMFTNPVRFARIILKKVGKNNGVK